MKFTGIIADVLPEASGVNKLGKAWRRRTYVCVYDNSNASYPKSIVFEVFGDKIDQLNIQPGMEYDLEIDFTAREWKSGYFLSATCWKAEPKAATTQPQPQQAYAPQGYQSAYPQQQQPAQPTPLTPPLPQGDDLPF